MKVQTGPRSVPSEVPPDPLGESAGGFGFFLVISPAAGRMRHLPPIHFREGQEWVAAGQPVAVIEQGTVSIEVKSPFDAIVAGILVRDGEPVQPGQPLVWLESDR